MAAQQLEDREVQDHDVDHDWTAQFFNDVQDVSSEEMQRHWAKILAGEVERPGSTSLRSLNILKGLDLKSAILFRRLCSARITPVIGLQGNGYVQAETDIVPSMDSQAAGNSLQEFGLGYASLNRLNEHGLIVPEYDSTWTQRVVDAGPDKSPRWSSMAFRFQGHVWVLVPIDDRNGHFDVPITGILLSNAGMELARVVDIEPMPEYQAAVFDHLEKRGLTLSEIDFGPPPLYTLDTLYPFTSLTPSAGHSQDVNRPSP